MGTQSNRAARTLDRGAVGRSPLLSPRGVHAVADAIVGVSTPRCRRRDECGRGQSLDPNGRSPPCEGIVHQTADRTVSRRDRPASEGICPGPARQPYYWPPLFGAGLWSAPVRVLGQYVVAAIAVNLAAPSPWNPGLSSCRFLTISTPLIPSSTKLHTVLPAVIARSGFR